MRYEIYFIILIFVNNSKHEMLFCVNIGAIAKLIIFYALQYILKFIPFSSLIEQTPFFIESNICANTKWNKYKEETKSKNPNALCLFLPLPHREGFRT
jgi:hypothetical protein